MTSFMNMDIKKNVLSLYGQYMYLTIFIDSDDDELVNCYQKHVINHNNNICKSINHIDAGFDLFSPNDQVLTNSGVNKIDYKVVCMAEHVTLDDVTFTGFYMYPRSSISKSHLRLANHVGIIDAGYRGHLMGMFDVVYKNEVSVQKLERHLQICAPNLMPIIVNLVSSREELGGKTIRDSGGFGSTGL